MAVFNKFNCFARDLSMAKHDLSTHVFKLRVSTAAPTATMDKIACITTIATGNGWSTDVSLTIADATASVATYALFFSDVTIEAAAASAMASFRYVVIYNSNDATGHLVGWYDYGTDVNLASGEKFVVDFDSTNGVIRVA
jgi:hypothetical protein